MDDALEMDTMEVFRFWVPYRKHVEIIYQCRLVFRTTFRR